MEVTTFIPYINKEQWHGEEVTIDNNLVENPVRLYHGNVEVGFIRNRLTLDNILCQIIQKHHDEVEEQGMEWTDYYIVDIDGNSHRILNDGRVENDNNIFALTDDQLRFIMGF